MWNSNFPEVYTRLEPLGYLNTMYEVRHNSSKQDPKLHPLQALPEVRFHAIYSVGPTLPLC
jgi:hypothetical protein